MASPTTGRCLLWDALMRDLLVGAWSVMIVDAQVDARAARSTAGVARVLVARLTI
jgi:hypothetical protein